DLLYRAVALTNSSGGIVEAYDTDAYGNTIIFTGPGTDGVWFTDDDLQSNYGANEIIFCGYRYDAETQLYYVRNRTYNPPLGRWIQRDPIGYMVGTNLFEYVYGMPTIQLDPDGLGFWNYIRCLSDCVSGNDPMNLLVGKLVLALAAVPLPKAWLAAVADRMGSQQLAQAIRKTVRLFGGQSDFMTMPSALSAALRAGPRSALRAIGRIAVPIQITYGLILADVEAYCAG
ncbi:MAG: RHS repeat-associated core domain-containing protein, partial [Phycisphaerae bacterium]|nr:RHS repeat-associated core domain-containing protein [Phycisphaerae bacterium]